VNQKINKSRREMLKAAVKGAFLLPYVVPSIETIVIQPLLMKDLYADDDDGNKGGSGAGKGNSGGNFTGKKGNSEGGFGQPTKVTPIPSWKKKKKCSPGFIWIPWKKECAPLKKLGS
jgi:hypothetical protein